MKRTSIYDLIDELMDSDKWDEIIEQVEREGINIDPNINPKLIASSLGKDYYEENINGKEYELTAELFSLQNKKTFMELFFRLKNLKQLKNLSTSNPHLETGITKTGDAKKVFDKIVSNFIAIIKKKNPNYVTFQAREQNRQRTYKHIIKQILKKIAGYKEISVSPLTNDEFDEDEFWVEKVENK
jgi:hypothetical protein